MDAKNSKIFFHIDVNSAFLSWTSVENLKNGTGPDLRDIPAIIGGDEENRHGIVLAKSIPAKKYGISTAEPIASARRKCPGLVIAPPDHTMYRRYSHALMEHLASFCPDIEQASIDECYMDFTPIAGKYSSAKQAAHLIKDSVYEKFGFTVNVGISNRKVLAKMASDFRKPNLVHTLFTDEIKEKMWPLPIEELFLCGKSSVQTLRKLGISTIGDLAVYDRGILEAHLKSHGLTLWNYANGIDDSDLVLEETQAKGIGNSTTLSSDLTDFEAARPVLLSLAESVSARLRRAGMKASCITLEIKYASFQSVSHQTILVAPTDTSGSIYKTACDLFTELWDHSPIRLLGIRSTKLTDAGDPVQLSLFDFMTDSLEDPTGPSEEKRQKLDLALDAIRNRYGKDSVVRGTFYHNDTQKHHED